jgi:AcrR family transcriptional regulator
MRTVPTTPKTSALLATARALFLKHGIRRVRVEEICNRAEVSKRTFYKYFRDRDDIAIRVIEQLTAEGEQLLEAIIDGKQPLEAKVRAIIAIKAEQFAAASAELYHEVLTADTAPGRFARAQMRDWEQRVRDFYRAAQRRGQIRRDLDLDLVLFLLTKVRDLFDDPALAKLALDRTAAAEAILKVLFYGIVTRRKP